MSSLIFQEHSESEFLTYCCHTHYTCYTAHYRSQVSVSHDMLAVPRWLMPMSASLSLLSKSICHANLVTLHHSQLGDEDSLKVDGFFNQPPPQCLLLKTALCFPSCRITMYEAPNRAMPCQTIPCDTKHCHSISHSAPCKYNYYHIFSPRTLNNKPNYMEPPPL